MVRGSGASTGHGAGVRSVTGADHDALRLETGPAAPTGRAARLWRVLIELSVQVEEARSAEKPRPLRPARLENIVVEFDDAYTAYVDGMERLPAQAQLLALQAVDRQLSEMVRAKEAALWTEQALRDDRRWGEARRLAREAIGAYAWPLQRLMLVESGGLSASEAEGGRSERDGQGPGRSA